MAEIERLRNVSTGLWSPSRAVKETASFLCKILILALHILCLHFTFFVALNLLSGNQKFVKKNVECVGFDKKSR